MSGTLTGAPVSIETYLASRRERVDRALEEFLPAAQTKPPSIHEAMRYSVLAGGKRIRPILAIAAAEACGADPEPLLKPFCAIELVHTYSLVHDDLPAIDNDDLRRGIKTCHVVFGEALAILAGDALLTEAFKWMSEKTEGLSAERQVQALSALARAIDSSGMIGGQVADIEGERAHEGPDDHAALAERLRFIHENKTGRLITASVEIGGLIGGGSDIQIALLRDFGRAIGLAFQIVDDLLDEEETAETLGKTAGKDAAQGKLTYPAVFGRDRAREEASSLLEQAVGKAAMIGGRLNYLPQIARYICERRS